MEVNAARWSKFVLLEEAQVQILCCQGQRAALVLLQQW